MKKDIMKLSHNSYWIKGDPVKVSKLFDCDIIEVDIIKGLKLSHSWRPFGLFCHGNLEDRYLKDFPSNKILYIEFKTGSKSIQKPLYNALKNSNAVNILLFAKDRNWFLRTFCKRRKNMLDFYNRHKDDLILILMKEFKKTTSIKSVDLYKKSIFHF